MLNTILKLITLQQDKVTFRRVTRLEIQNRIRMQLSILQHQQNNGSTKSILKTSEALTDLIEAYKMID